mmetsp:Transcript_17065/g.25594  ORF Transcript_17065/g.25594 Transcript_17065/m.25594 type:complete len:393 (+) Transcript_17065:74-1252(+)
MSSDPAYHRVGEDEDEPVGRSGSWIGCGGCCDCFISCWKKYQTPIPPDESLSLTAIQKWQQYRRPPWKLILSLFIAICTTSQIILYALYIAPYVRNGKIAYQELFQPPDNTISTQTFGQRTIYNLYTKENLANSLTHVARVYFEQRNVTLDYYSYGKEPNVPGSIDLYVTKYRAGKKVFDESVPFDSSTYTDVYSIRDQADMNQVLKQNITRDVEITKSIEAHFSLNNYNLYSISQSCYAWNINSRYKCDTSGKCDYDVLASPVVCSDVVGASTHFKDWTSSSARDGCICLLVAILAFCSISQILYVKAVASDIRTINRRDGNPVSIVSESKLNRPRGQTSATGGTRGRTQTMGSPSSERRDLSPPVLVFDDAVPWSEAIKFINGWVIMATV